MPAPRTILIFRPYAGAAAFAAALEARRPGAFRAVAAPLFTIEPLPADVDAAGVAGVALTSAHAVPAAVQLELPHGTTAWCVGRETEAAARAAGLVAVSADGDAGALVRTIVAARPDGAVLYLRGAHASADLVARLGSAGVTAREAVVYDQRATPLPAEAEALLASGAVDVAAFFSARGARLFSAAAEASGWRLDRTDAVSIGAGADAELAGLGFAGRRVAATPDRAGMLDAIAGDAGSAIGL